MTKRTIFSSYEGVERYLKLAEHNEIATSALVTIEPLDAFLIQQTAAFYAIQPTIVDLAWEATAGVSLAVWNTYPEDVKAVIPVSMSSQKAASETALPHMLEMLRREPGSPVRDALQAALDTEAGWHEFEQHLPPVSPVIVLVAHVYQDHLAEKLTKVTRLLPDATVIVFPVGRANGLVMQAIAQVLQSISDRDVVLGRELHFALHNSQLGFLFARDHKYLPPSIERIRQLFVGNFDYLSLAEMNLALQQALAKKDSLLAALTPPVPPPAPVSDVPETAQRRGSVLPLLRQTYHSLVPLPTRLKLRAIRVSLIGR